MSGKALDGVYEGEDAGIEYTLRVSGGAFELERAALVAREDADPEARRPGERFVGRVASPEEPEPGAGAGPEVLRLECTSFVQRAKTSSCSRVFELRRPDRLARELGEPERLTLSIDGAEVALVERR